MCKLMMLFLYCLFLLCHDVVNVKYAVEKEHCEYLHYSSIFFFFPSPFFSTFGLPFRNI